jgi:hypothetical protein
MVQTAGVDFYSVSSFKFGHLQSAWSGLPWGHVVNWRLACIDIKQING